jgi:ribosomal protein S18 acetylase RimI-like enzyme
VEIRFATEADEPVLRDLWDAFAGEVPEPEPVPPDVWEEDWSEWREALGDGAIALAEDEHGAVGVAVVAPPERGRAHVDLVYVAPRARRRGVAKALLAAALGRVRERGATVVTLDVLMANADARTVWSRLGFKEIEVTMATTISVLADRLDDRPRGASHGSTHVQTDDESSVERAVAQFLPRLEAPDVRGGESWMRIADPLLDRDREAHGRFARELSDRLGAVVVALAVENGVVVRFRLYERGRMVDEYLSVPRYYGELSTVDELALAANPTLVARLTGADREEVRRVARTAATPAELPPAEQLYAEIARVMGLEH